VPEQTIDTVSTVVPPGRLDRSQAFGEALPEGLRLE
jgi:hypothetical protein